MRVGIALGSNLNDRLQLLRSAREHLQRLHETDGPFLCSKIYETQPVDCQAGAPSFLNAAIELSSTIPPLDILRHLQAIEIALGRAHDHQFHAPRTIDLDLLYCDNIQISQDMLILPHKEISNRSFVLQPLNDICPERMLPGQTRAIRELFGILPKLKHNECISFSF